MLQDTERKCSEQEMNLRWANPLDYRLTSFLCMLRVSGLPCPVPLVPPVGCPLPLGPHC